MHISKIISFPKIGLFLLMLHFITTPTISANEEKNKKDDKVTITKEELISIFGDDSVVVGHVIEGSDIIDIIKDPDCQDYHINIKNSVIKGGLDFSSVPETHIDDITFPEEWDEKYRKEFKEKNGGKKYRVVKNLITIVRSDTRFFS